MKVVSYCKTDYLCNLLSWEAGSPEGSQWEQTSLHDAAIVRTANEIHNNSQGAGRLGALKVVSGYKRAPMMLRYTRYRKLEILGVLEAVGPFFCALYTLWEFIESRKNQGCKGGYIIYIK